MDTTIETQKPKKRLREIDLLKGFGIILMVYCHISLPAYSYFSLFHMAIFVMASGMLFDPKRFETKEGIRGFWKGKFLHLYLPYILINLFFLAFNNLFVQIKLYPTEMTPDAAEMGGVFQKSLDASEFFLHSIMILLTFSSTLMGDATWFLAALLWTETLYFLSALVFSRLLKQKRWIEVVVEMLVSFQMLMVMFLFGHEAFPQEVKWLIVFAYCFSLGRAFSFVNAKIQLAWWVKLIVFLVSGLGLYALNHIGSVGIWSGVITNPFFFTAATLFGWCFSYYGCSLLCHLPTKATEPLAYLGKKTLWIIGFHFISFKIATLIYIHVRELPIAYFGFFPTLPINGDIGMGLVYLSFGLFAPLILALLYEASSFALKSLVQRKRLSHEGTLKN